MTDRILLTESEKCGAVWCKVQEFLEQRLEMLRKENDADTDERATARRRGAINEVKTLMALGREKPNL